MPTSEEIQARREAKLEELGQKLESAVEQLVSGEDWVRAMRFAAQFRSRSFANTLLILLQHAQAHDEGRVSEPWPTYVAGFNQWQQLGRSVMKGQHGYVILAPVTARYASFDVRNANGWRKLGKGEKPRPGETVATKMDAVKPAYVFDVSQTDGEPIPQRPTGKLPAGQAPPGLWDALAAQIHDHGFELRDAPTVADIGGANGMTDFLARTVHIRRDTDAAARVKILAHELAHIVLGHEAGAGGATDRGIGEVEAESVAVMVTAAHGMEVGEYSIPYVAGWSTRVKDREPTEVVRATGETVRKAALAILDKLPDPPVGDGNPPGLDAGINEHRQPEPTAARTNGLPEEPPPTSAGSEADFGLPRDRAQRLGGRGS